MHPEFTRQLGDRPVPSDRRQRHLRLEPRIMFLSCPLHVLLPRYPRVLGAGLHLSQLSHFRGPPQYTEERPYLAGGTSSRFLHHIRKRLLSALTLSRDSLLTYILWRTEIIP